jgi:glycosyltransferase involved in cell wall biosynthesis
MIRVLLVHGGIIPHYRVPIYTFMSVDFRQQDFDLIVVADGIQADNPDAIGFKFVKMHLSISTLTHFIYREKIDVIIDYMELRHRYLFPLYFVAKGILRRKMIYWGQGRDLLEPNAIFKNLAYFAEQAMCDAIILYAEHLKKYVPKGFHKKVFIANNTLSVSFKGLPPGVTKETILAEFGIRTKKNIICIGRMQKRKRLQHLVEAYNVMKRPEFGLIFVGPDPEGVLAKIEGDHIFKLGPIYGDKKYQLLSSADVFCLPGAVGLSIVDAFHCGLPLVTEDGDESAEIMYLKHDVNGFIVPRGDILALSQRLLLLLENDELRKRFSDAAKKEVRANASLDVFCSGFRNALRFIMER